VPHHDVLFPFGRLVATPGALNALATSGESPVIYLARHQHGDWGDLARKILRPMRVPSYTVTGCSVRTNCKTEASFGSLPKPIDPPPHSCFRPSIDNIK
jgi:hypothetical protein